MDMKNFNLDLNEMCDFVGDFADEQGLAATVRALPYAREKHEGQRRTGNGSVPYISHPLQMACHAIALDLTEDELLATILLHDVCEECGVSPASLPMNRSIQNAVALVTREDDESKAQYYAHIGENPIATLTKLIDRCHNVSHMSMAFNRKKLMSYMDETNRYVLPLLEQAREKWPQYNKQYWLIEYQIRSILQTVEALLHREDL